MPLANTSFLFCSSFFVNGTFQSVSQLIITEQVKVHARIIVFVFVFNVIGIYPLRL